MSLFKCQWLFLCQQCQLLYIETYFCLLRFWTAFYQGVKLMFISVILHPLVVMWKHNISHNTKIQSYYSIFYVCIFRHSLSIRFFSLMNSWITSCSMLYVFVWYVFLNCLVIFYNISDGKRGLICPLLEPETLSMPFVFFLYSTDNALKGPDRVHREAWLKLVTINRHVKKVKRFSFLALRQLWLDAGAFQVNAITSDATVL